MENLTLMPLYQSGGNRNTIHQFFEDYPLELIEKKLWNFCQSRVHLAAADEGESVVEDMVFYEDLIDILQKLKPIFADNVDYIITPSFSEHTLVSLEGIINLIKQAIPVGVIYNLSKVKEEPDLLIVLEKSCTKPYAEFEHIIDLALLGYPKGTCTVHNYGLLNVQINGGHLFYATACVESNVVYRKNIDEVFAIADPILMEEMKAKSKSAFEIGMDKVANFYNGAQHYLEDHTYEMAIFMLQQACELTYRCLLNVLRGKDVKCHSPVVLRKHVRRFAPEIIGVFSVVEEEEVYYLEILEDSYVKSRYNPTYTIDKALLIFLNGCVGVLQERARMLVEAKVGLGLQD